jgi:hypothetical protein
VPLPTSLGKKKLNRAIHFVALRKMTLPGHLSQSGLFSCASRDSSRFSFFFTVEPLVYVSKSLQTRAVEFVYFDGGEV